MHLHPHPNFIIRDADADAGPLPSGPYTLPLGMKNFAGSIVDPA